MVSPKILRRIELIHSDFYYFLKYCSYTPVGDGTAPARFPIDELGYLKAYMNVLKTEKRIITFKGRQLMFSWMHANLYAWELLTTTYGDHLAFAQDEVKSIEFGKRVRAILDNIPENIWPKPLRPKHQFTQERIYVPSLNNNLFCFPASGNKGHGWTTSSVFFDEFGRHPNAAEAKLAIMGADVKLGKNRIYMVSTGDRYIPGEKITFKELTEDIPISPEKELVPGMTLTHLDNGLAYVKAYYYCDPSRDKEWEIITRKKLKDVDFEISHNLSWANVSGQGVFSDLYDEQKHRVGDVLPHPRFGPIIIGVDFGGNQSFAVCQPQGREFVVLAEFPNRGFGLAKNLTELVSSLKSIWGEDLFSSLVIKYAPDPSGQDHGKEMENTSLVDYLIEFSGHRSKVVIPRTNLITPRITAVRDALSEDRLRLSSSCKFLNEAMKGGYHWPENQLNKSGKPSPVKNEYSHIMDALQYAVMVVEDLKNEFGVRIINPGENIRNLI